MNFIHIEVYKYPFGEAAHMTGEHAACSRIWRSAS